jgi:hypothetical protein
MFFDNYYIKGGISGMTGIILSHPVDSIKTHYQTNNMKQKYKFTLYNLYRGLSAPLIGVGIEKAIVFGTYNYFKDSYGIPISGAISGLVASLVVSPYERIKIIRQTNQLINYSPKFLFKGLSATFTREVPGFAIYFSTYETLKDNFYTKKNKEITIPASFIFGGLSGTMAWIFIYPQDRIKTIIQSNKTNENVINIIKKTYKSGSLYSGFSYAIMRAILLHSGTFSMMEFIK